METLSPEEVLQNLRCQTRYAQNKYLAMYSTWLGGVVTDPALMSVPVDDHMVHRGDGVFETFRSRGKQLLEIEAHLHRLERSANSLGISLPKTMDEIYTICKELLAFDKGKDVLFRLYVSRGPGGFTTNPYECLSSQLYLVMTEFVPYSKKKYESGVTVVASHILAKPPPFVQFKSCNYLPNVMMKKEAIDREVDFTVCFTEEGFLGEGSGENILIVTSQKEVLAPLFDYTLQGTTLLRVLELARSEIAGSLGLTRVDVANLRREDLDQAEEVMLAGTAIGLLPVIKWEGQKIGRGVPGPVFKLLHKKLVDFYGD